MNQPSHSNIWSDDALNRSSMAERLTNVVEHEHGGIVISLNGGWGSGKTFFLTRWQQHLEQKGFRTLYLNAWQDEFCDEPIVAISSQLDAFSKENNLASIWQNFQVSVAPILLHNIESLVKNKIGLSQDIKMDQPVQIYSERMKLKDQLVKELIEITAKIDEETKKPLIFIVDELDRCRPNYSLDFLEKIVHIFQVPNIVFVFGINKEELLSSLKSIYGNIDSGVYLRRFFQREFIMQPSSRTDFCRRLIASLGLRKAFGDIDYMHYISDFETSFSAIADIMKLSLRDIEYCFRVIDFIAKNLSNRPPVHPLFLAVLIPLSLVNNSLYKRLVQGEKIGSTVVDFLDEFRDELATNTTLDQCLDIAEIYLYSTYSNYSMDHNPAFQQLNLLLEGKDLTNAALLSERTRNSSPQRARELIQKARNLLYLHHGNCEALKAVSSLIELVSR